MSSSRRGEHGPGIALGTQGSGGGMCCHCQHRECSSGMNIRAGLWSPRPWTAAPYSRSGVVLGGSHLDQLHTSVKGEKRQSLFLLVTVQK